MSFAGQTAVVTGASSGIGRELARQLAARGAKVGVVARRAELLQELVAEIRAAGGTVEAATADVSDRTAVLAAVGELKAKLGPVDLMIANAGVSAPTGADPVNVPGVELMTKVNFLGVVYAFESVLPAMLARKSGHLVAVSSLAAYKGLPGAAGYCATKAAVNTYCESLRIELGDRGVAVTCVCPGFIHTPMTADQTHPMPFLMDADRAAGRILNALRRRPKVYNFPWLMYRLMKVTRWLPDFVIRRRAMRISDPH
jgi:short-subunit dehydrogenase